MRKKIFQILILIFIMIFACGTMICCGDPNPSPDGNNPGENQPSDNDPNQKQPEYIEGREVISADDVNTFSSEFLRIFGRTYKSGKLLGLANAGTGVETTFYGTELKAIMTSGTAMYVRAYVDDDSEGTRYKVDGRNQELTLAQNLTEGFHTVRLLKATSGNIGDMSLKSLSTDGKFIRPENKTHLRMEFIGDSITVGAGIFATPDKPCSTENSDAMKCYAYLTAREFDADFSIVAAEAICTYDTISPYMPNNIDMLTMYDCISSNNNKPYTYTTEHNVVVIGLGTNDSSYMNAHPEYDTAAYAMRYKELIDKIRAKNPNAYIVCAYGLMNTDQRIKTGIQSAITACDDEKISYVDIPAGANGGSLHPSVTDAVTQSEVLITHIRSAVPGLSENN